MAQSCTDLNITIYNEMHLKPTMFYIQYYPAAKVEKQSLQPIIMCVDVGWWKPIIQLCTATDAR